MTGENLLTAPDSQRRLAGLEALAASLLHPGRLRLLDGQPLPQKAADELLVAVVATTLRAMLCARRVHGLAPWHVAPGQNKDLAAQLQAHVANGELLEAIRVAAVMHARQHTLGGAA
ncbi:MAG: hypothetical protein KJ007_02950 [Burkholderiales bacterium]|nr:hypothetical protein [Burkholderiales bacterium]